MTEHNIRNQICYVALTFWEVIKVDLFNEILQKLLPSLLFLFRVGGMPNVGLEDEF